MPRSQALTREMCTGERTGEAGVHDASASKIIPTAMSTWTLKEGGQLGAGFSFAKKPLDDG